MLRWKNCQQCLLYFLVSFYLYFRITCFSSWLYNKKNILFHHSNNRGNFEVAICSKKGSRWKERIYQRVVFVFLKLWHRSSQVSCSRYIISENQGNFCKLQPVSHLSEQTFNFFLGIVSNNISVSLLYSALSVVRFRRSCLFCNNTCYMPYNYNIQMNSCEDWASFISFISWNNVSIWPAKKVYIMFRDSCLLFNYSPEFFPFPFLIIQYILFFLLHASCLT